ncbi:DUF7344 domain-containing protein [Halomontanus rarus]|uniref:DUF7344 domain-containing protein n=1 Tax=Halomontanus rarus TaxID=3034020 RepID=UPI003CE466A5
MSAEFTDQVIRALSEQRRRSTLRVLQQHQEATISKIAKEIAAKEDDGPNSDVRSDAVHIDLYHCHIPILAEAGLVHYTEDQDVVAISEHGTNITAFLGRRTLFNHQFLRCVSPLFSPRC